MGLALATGVQAHPLAPALLEIEAQGENRAEIAWKTSRLRPRGADIRPLLPEACPAVSDPVADEDQQSVTLRWQVECADGGSWVGRRIAVSGLEALSLIHI